MYRDTRAATPGSTTASTPDMWARRFAEATRMTWWRRFRMTTTREWALVRKYVPRHASILDAGCGFGDWVMFLKSKEFDARGLDYSGELVTRLRETYPGADWQVGDIRTMPYADGSFDAVISWGVIEHDEAGPGATLREFYRVLRPGGTVIVTVPVDSQAQRRAAEYFRQGEGVQTFFQYFMTAEELAAHLDAAGLRVLDQGVLPNAVIHLVSPRLAGSLSGPALRAANFFVSTFMSWLPRYCVMRYAVAVRDEALPPCARHVRG